MKTSALAECVRSGFVFAIGLFAVTAAADSSATKQRSDWTVGEGIHVIRHADAPDGNPQGNTAVVIGERDVLVVDSGYLPSSAREDIRQIRQWTDKPVRYLLNTHWHPDHQRGNAAYVEAFPGITIVAHSETSRLMALYEAGNLVRYPLRQAALRKQVATGKGEDGKRLSEDELRTLRQTYAGQQKVLDELQGSRMQLPTLTFDHSIDIDLGNRRVEISHLGPGDTLGDAWAYLPEEKLLITGDVLTAPVPYFFAGYPAELAKTLRFLNQLDALVIVPGHGDVMHDKTYLRSVLALLDTVIAQVNTEIARRGSLSARLEDVRKAIDTGKYRRQFAGDDPDSQAYFDESIEGLIKDAFYQAPK
jgi:glyoxylase-like metal-dependent hydrolase (beta-lactamase superfamily II)